MSESASPPESREIPVPGAASLEEGESLAFHWEGDARSGGGFVLRHASGLLAFRNRCPHWGVDLDMQMGGFYDDKIDRVFCRTHGALFRLTDGYCTEGPCEGDSLLTLPIVVSEDGWVAIGPEPDEPHDL